MAGFHCPTKSLCIDPSTPFQNLTAEAADSSIFIARNTGFGPSYPPLGSEFTADGCVSFCESTVSQEDADLCAARQNVECTSVIFPVGQATTDVNGDPAVLQRPRPVFRSRAQTATVHCPDGLPFLFTVPPGVFEAFNQATADAEALSYAQQQALIFRLCLGGLTSSKVCVDTPYTATITASGKFISNAPPGDVWQLVTGAFPPGITVSEFIFTTGLVVGGTIHFTGQCAVPGVYPFTLRVTDSQGDTMTKSYAITISGVINGLALPDGTVGTAYSEDLTSAGVTNPIFSLESGALPDGLTLNGTPGFISGTPTLAGTFNFTLGVTEAGTGITCVSPASIKINPAAFNCGVVAQNVQDVVFTPAYFGSPCVLGTLAAGISADWSMTGASGPCPQGSSMSILWTGTICNPGDAYLVTLTVPWTDSGFIATAPPWFLRATLTINGVPASMDGDLGTGLPSPLTASVMLPGHAVSTITVQLFENALGAFPGLVVNQAGNLTLTPLTHP